MFADYPCAVLFHKQFPDGHLAVGADCAYYVDAFLRTLHLYAVDSVDGSVGSCSGISAWRNDWGRVNRLDVEQLKLSYLKLIGAIYGVDGEAIVRVGF